MENETMQTNNSIDNASNITQNLTTMTQIANNNICVDSIGTSTDATNQFKAFLVAQAKNEMRRIIKLINYLEIVEDRFLEVSNTLIQEYPDNMEIVSETMKVLTACINRSNELITQVVSDDKLNSFIFSQPIVTEDKVLPLESRNKIRDLANHVLNQLDSAAEDTQN